MSMAYRESDPHKALQKLLFDDRAQQVHSSFDLAHLDLKAFLRHILPEPAPDSALAQDLMLLTEQKSSEPLEVAVQFMYFATNHCHLFGTMKVPGKLTIAPSRPIACFSAQNTPCSYMWVDMRKAVSGDDLFLPRVVKHNMDLDDMARPFYVRVVQPEGEVNVCIDLETCSCPVTMREGFIVFTVEDGKRVRCDGKAPIRSAPYALVLSFCGLFSQTMLCMRDGRIEPCYSVLHDSPI